MRNLLNLVCFLGHQLGALTIDDAGTLALAPRIDEGHYIGWHRRQAVALSTEGLAGCEPYPWTAEELTDMGISQPDPIPRYADISDEETARLLNGPTRARDGWAAQSVILTPDRGALAWSCADCFRAGIGGATHRRPGLYHHGRAAAPPFLRLLLAQPAGSVAPVESAAKSALARLSTMPDPAAVAALRAQLGQLPAPTWDDYREWDVVRWNTPSNRAARERFTRNRYNTP